MSVNSLNNEGGVSIIRYRSVKPVPRAMITLPRNMITFLLDGEKTVHFAGMEVNVKPHQFVMLAAGNCLMSEKIAAAGSEYHSILIFFDNTIIANFFDRHSLLIERPAKTVDP